MRQLFAILLLVSASCADFYLDCETLDCVDKSKEYAESRYHVLDSWDQVIGPVSNNCATWIKDVRIFESVDVFKLYDLEYSGMAYTYNSDGKLEAAMIYIHPHKPRKECIAVHELVHILDTCEFDDSDDNHSRSQLWTRHGPNTVESIGCQDL
jgi:hypothetical protein